MTTLTWIGPITTGCSHMTFFSKNAAGEEAMMIIPVSHPRDCKPAWEIRFMDGSGRRPIAPPQPTLEAAKLQAEAELSQPISPDGAAFRLNNVAIDSQRL